MYQVLIVFLYGAGNDTIPTLSLTPPENFSGDITGITISLVAHDTDTDSTHTDSSTVGTTTTVNNIIYDTIDSVTLNLYVDPIADDIAVMAGKTINEDTAAVFLNDLALTDTDTDGSESITQVVISGLHNGSVIHYGGVDTTITDGTFTIGDGNSSLDLATVQAATITPPAHSSLDMDLTVTATVEDISTVNASPQTDTQDYIKTFTVKVNPIAESTQTDSAGAVANDIITQGSHTYTDHMVEDTFVNINTLDGFALFLTNEDVASETTTVLFTPKDDLGNNLIGTTFKYGTTVITFNGTAVKIPSNELVNLQVKAPAQYSGDLVISTQIQAVDSDDDVTGKEPASTVISAGDTLTLVVDPVPDDVTVGIKQSFGFEDTLIPLSVKVTSDDNDENYTIVIHEIPIGAEIYYDGSSLTLTPDGPKNSVTITNYDNTKPLSYLPVENSSDEVTLQVDAWSVDGGVEGTHVENLDIKINVTGVADNVIDVALVTESITDTGSISHDYNTVVTEDTSSVNISSLFSDANPLQSFDSVDGSEELFIKITDVPTGFTISGSNVVHIGSNWLVSRDDFDTVNINIPGDYSGEVNFTLLPQTVENDGDKLTPVAIPLSILVTPEAESSVVTTDAMSEDGGTNVLNFGFNQADSGETLESIWIDTETIDAGVTLETTVSGDLVQTTVGTPQWVELSIVGNVVETVTAVLDSSWDQISGAYDFDIRYQVSDTVTTTDGTYTDYSKTDGGSDVYKDILEASDYITFTYSSAVNAVTDPATSSIGLITDDSSQITVTGTGTDVDKYNISAADNTTIDLPLILTSDLDTDGSEHVLTTVTISGVPEGVGVVGGVYSGDTFDTSGNIVNSGNWTLELSTDLVLDGDGATNIIQFIVDGETVTFNEYTGANLDTPDTADDDISTITLTIEHQDGSADVLSNEEAFEFTLDDGVTTLGDIADTDVNIANVTGSAMDIELTTPAPALFTEDTGKTLASLVTVDDGITSDDSSKFAIIIKDLPVGMVISGMSYNANAGGYVLLSDTITALDGVRADGRDNGEGSVADIIAALSTITVTPVSNYNVNDYPSGDYDFNVEIVTYNSEGQIPNSYSTEVTFDIAPVTDPTTISITGNTITENSSEIFTISLSNTNDDTRTQIIDGNLYVQLIDNGYAGGDGTIADHGVFTGVGFTLPAVTTIGAGTVTDEQGNALPAGDYYVIGGTDYTDSLQIEYTPPADLYGGDVSIEAYIISKEDPLASGYTTQSLLSSGTQAITITPVNEGFTGFDASASGLEDNIVYLDITNVGLSDPTENVTGATLSGVPYGYEVYYDGSLVTGTISGDDGAGNYLYDYSFNATSVALLETIGIKAPIENWSGTLSGLTLTVTSGESGGSVDQTKVLDFEFNAVADPLVNMTATQAFGDESAWTDVNLNINVTDVDGSETISVSFTGNGETLPDGFIFSLDGGSTTYANVSYNAGVYTITDIPFDEINNVSMLAPVGIKGTHTVDVSAWTVETSNGDASTALTDTFDINLNSKASGVTAFTSVAGSEVNTIISGDTIAGAAYEVSLHIDALDLLDKDGTESLYVTISGLGTTLVVDTTAIAGISAEKVGADWIIDIGSATDVHYEAALIALANGDLNLITDVSG